jgi:hypothetical protein
MLRIHRWPNSDRGSIDCGAAVAQVVRLAGVPEGAGQDFVDMVAPAQPRKPQ